MFALSVNDGNGGKWYNGNLRKDFTAFCRQKNIKVVPIGEKEKLYPSRVYFIVFPEFDGKEPHVVRTEFTRSGPKYYHKPSTSERACEVTEQELYKKFCREDVKPYIFEYVG